MEILRPTIAVLDDTGSDRAYTSIADGEGGRLRFTAFSDGDPVIAGAERVFQAEVPGAKGREHPVIRGAGHFLQEDKGRSQGRVRARASVVTPTTWRWARSEAPRSESRVSRSPRPDPAIHPGKPPAVPFRRDPRGGALPFSGRRVEQNAVGREPLPAAVTPRGVEESP
jgi:hypothetical protein